MTGDWLGVPDMKVDPEQRAKAIERASLFRSTFTTDAGKKVLEILKGATIERPVIKPDSTQFGAGIREGQNDLVRQIIDQIRIAEEGING